MRAPSDAALIRAAQRGSADAFAELYRRHWPQTHRAAYLVLHDAAAAEDVAQEAFLSAVTHLDRFDRRRPLGPWLYRIAVNRALDWARAGARRGERGDAGLDALAAAEAAPAVEPQLLAALRALSPDRRAVVVLRHLLGLTPKEIAAALEIPRGTVNSRLRRGLDEIEALLRRDGSS